MGILQRKVLFGGLIALIVIIIVFVVFLYRPIMIKNRKIDKEIVELKKKIKENEEMAQDISRLRQTVAELEQKQQAFMMRIVPRKEMLATVRQLVDLSDGYNLVFSEIKPPGLDTILESDKPTAPIKPIPFLLTIQGRYIDIARYIESLTDFPYFLRTPEIEIIGREDLRPNVEARLLINLYVSSLVIKSS